MQTHFFVLCCSSLCSQCFQPDEGGQKYDLHSQVPALIISRRNILEQLMPTLGEASGLLSAMIHLVADLYYIIFTIISPLLGLCTRYGKGMSPVRSWILPLPILIKKDPAFWWQPILCQFWSKKIQLLGGKICH